MICIDRESMELSDQHGYLEDLLEAPITDILPTFPSNQLLYSNAWNFHSTFPSSNPTYFEYPFDQTYPFFGGFSSVPSMVHQNDEFGHIRNPSFEFDNCKLQMQESTNNNLHNAQVFCMGSSVDIEINKSKRLQGKPSKNLMAERRRRKRFNDRLSMLRSMVPNISKLQEEEGEEGINEATLINSLKEIKPNEVLMKNSPKFHVERKEMDTQIDISCLSKPGLLLSTVNTLEALGLEIQQCVISCFNDFSVQASCSEAEKQRTILTPEDIKQALFRTAGY